MSLSKVERLLEEFFLHQLSLKMYHFQTKSYGAHKASDQYLITFALNFDRMMEVTQGEFGQIKTKRMNLKLTTLTDGTVKAYLTEFVRMLEDLENSFGDYPGILAIRDEMVAEARKLKYLLLFK